MAWGGMEQAEEKQCIHEREERWRRGAEHDQMIVMGLIPRALCCKHQSVVCAY